MKNRVWCIGPVLALVVLSGCHSLRFAGNTPPGTPSVTRQAHYFGFGTFGSSELDLASACPQGVARVQDTVTYRDVLYTVASVGIYTPRTMVVECKAAA